MNNDDRRVHNLIAKEQFKQTGALYLIAAVIVIAHRLDLEEFFSELFSGIWGFIVGVFGEHTWTVLLAVALLAIAGYCLRKPKGDDDDDDDDSRCP